MGVGCNGDKLSQGELVSASPISSTLNPGVELVTTDESKTVIAEFHRAQRKQKARLAVQPAGVNMLDYIILTFVFAETKRREREAGLKSSGSGTGLLIFLVYRHVYPAIKGGGG